MKLNDEQLIMLLNKVNSTYDTLEKVAIAFNDRITELEIRVEHLEQFIVMQDVPEPDSTLWN